MNRIAEYAAILKNDSAAPLAGSHPVDPHLRSLLVHIAFADGEVDGTEFALLDRLVPELDSGALLMWVAEEAQRPMDLEALLEAVPLPSDRRALVELAKHMARADGFVHEGEAQLVDLLKAMVHL